MSSAKLEIVRSIYAAWERGDFRGADWADPEIEYVAGDGPEPETWRGTAGIADAWSGFLGAWRAYSARAEEYRELDDERVLVTIRAVGIGGAAGIAMEMKGANLFHVHDGKVTRLVLYSDRNRAFADVGLTPEGRAP